MRGQIVYIKGHAESEQQAQQGLNSFKKNKWEVELVEGVTPKTVKDTDEYKNYKIIDKSRLHDFKKQNYNRFLTKVSCAINHIRFWEKVVDENETLAFLEHDSISVMDFSNLQFNDYLILNAEYVFKPPSKLNLNQFRNYEWSGFGINKLPENYPLKYYRDNIWKDSSMVPGTGSYAITPKGATKMLDAIERCGLDQSDYMLNSFNVDIQYILPSPVKFNTVNLSTSYGVSL